MKGEMKMLQKTAVIGLAMLFVMTGFTGCLSSDDNKETTHQQESVNLM